MRLLTKRKRVACASIGFIKIGGYKRRIGKKGLLNKVFGF